MLGSGLNGFKSRGSKAAANFLTKLDRLPKWILVGTTFVILGCVAAIDFLTGYEISCTVFYLVAAGLATWYVGASFGILVSVLSAISTSTISSFPGNITPIVSPRSGTPRSSSRFT